MISVWYEDKPSLSAFGPKEFVAELEALGVRVGTGDSAAEGDVRLVFANVESAAVTALSADARARTVVFDEGGARSPGAEARRETLGLLGLVDASAWFKWRGGMLVVWGLYGRTDVANAANLVSKPEGLQGPDTTLALPELLARYLFAAERVLGTKRI
jgi:hypothetical protein